MSLFHHDRVAYLDLTFGEDLCEDSFPGHDTISDLLEYCTPGMAFLAYLGNAEYNIVSDQ
jgi:hypothetical protein